MSLLDMLLTGCSEMNIIAVEDKFCIRRFSISTLFTKFTPYEYANIKNNNDIINDCEDCKKYKPCWKTKNNLTEDYFGSKDDATMSKLSILIQELEYWSRQCSYEINDENSSKYDVPKEEWYYEI